ncbi:hypothetical protein [Evansella cellulosilytica]|uniref:Uncharacterized protein n=1 Tax=Evansella cellulosilytica (strain ATCC 21833 / DSM 2522 / FERM P-1141 / JCM 9156 / N-4) TaxID=649639 RepID=E6TQU5_EVAC2|nr:hypothetical protein [Evansella cellulosilytica]ADU31720.1 hypothetical protein Bcell_3478 [Evansella cellulosilytica DSM 2522]
MEITFTRMLTLDEKEKVRLFVGYYRGIPTFKEDHVLEIQPKQNFSEDQFIETIKSLDIPIENVDVTV